jgi:glycosyltransferase involved in cell wall biosynthesis
MKIAIFTDTFFPQQNGVTTHIVQTSRKLCENGHEVLIFAPKAELKFKTQINGLKVVYLPSIAFTPYEGLRLATPFFPQLNNKIKAFRPDIIHFHTPSTVGVNGILQAKLFKIPLVGTFHTYFMEPEYLRILGFHKVNLDNNHVVNRLAWQLSNIFYNRADIVIAPTVFTKKDLLKNGLSAPVKVISNGIDLASMKDQNNKEYNLPTKYMLYVGRLSEEKSLHILLKSFGVFAQTNPDVKLLLVGDGPMKSNLKTTVKELGIAKRVIFYGKVNNDELVHSPIYKNALAFVTASKSETQCISLLEAAAFGIPLIGVKARGVADLIGKFGLLCKPDNITDIAEAMRLIAGSPEERKILSNKSLKLAKEHSLGKTVKELERLYLNLLS